jgi:hypothetical protein
LTVERLPEVAKEYRFVLLDQRGRMTLIRPL